WELGGDGWPTVSPDGRWLAYIRGISGSRKELRVRNLATGEERLLGADSRLIHLAWSQDSKTVLAAITIWTGTEIQAFPRDGARLIRSTPHLPTSLISPPVVMDRWQSQWIAAAQTLRARPQRPCRRQPSSIPQTVGPVRPTWL